MATRPVEEVYDFCEGVRRCVRQERRPLREKEVLNHTHSGRDPSERVGGVAQLLEGKVGASWRT